MDSSPPATAMAASPARNWSAAIMMAFMPEPHILLMVVGGTPWGMPAASAAWRAGAWPSPADNTHPMMTSCTSAPVMPAAASAPRIAAAPSCGAEAGERAPWNAPMGVRWAETMTTELADLSMRLPCSGSITAPQAVREEIDETLRDLVRLERRIVAVPVAHPVERAGQRECRHAGIAFADGAVGDACFDQGAHALVDAGLE